MGTGTWGSCWPTADVRLAWVWFVLLNTRSPPPASLARAPIGGRAALEAVGLHPFTDSHGCGVVVPSLDCFLESPGTLLATGLAKGFANAPEGSGKCWGQHQGVWLGCRDPSFCEKPSPCWGAAVLHSQAVSSLGPGFQLSGLGTGLACSPGQGPLVAECGHALGGGGCRGWVACRVP